MAQVVDTRPCLDDVEVENFHRPLIDHGLWIVRVRAYECAPYLGGHKLYLHCVPEAGPVSRDQDGFGWWPGTRDYLPAEGRDHPNAAEQIDACYTVQLDRGRLIAKRGSKLADAYLRVLGHRPPRHDRLSAKLFVGKVLLVRVGDVVQDSHHDPYPPHMCYSTVRKIVGPVPANLLAKLAELAQ